MDTFKILVAIEAYKYSPIDGEKLIMVLKPTEEDIKVYQYLRYNCCLDHILMQEFLKHLIFKSSPKNEFSKLDPSLKFNIVKDSRFNWGDFKLLCYKDNYYDLEEDWNWFCDTYKYKEPYK